MRKGRLVALAALLCAGLAVSVAAADDDVQPPSKTTWWPGDLFAGKAKVEQKKPAGKLDSADEGPAAAQRTSDLQTRAKNAYWRRLAACDRLREIAVQTQDPALEQKVERLNQQVFEAYLRRMSGDSGGRFETADGFTETKPGKAKATKAGEDKP